MSVINPTSMLGPNDLPTIFTRASTATFFGSNKLMQTAAVNVQRIAYDPYTGVLIGPMLEAATTNLATYTETLATGWATSGCTRSSVSVANPTGATSMARITEGTGTIFPSIYLNTYYASGSLTLSVFASIASAGRYLTLSMDTRCIADLSAGTITYVEAGGTATIQRISATLYRVSLTSTMAANPNIQVGLSSTPTSFPTYTGNGTSAFNIWGVQLEAGPLTSYISSPGATQVTRAAESITPTPRLTSSTVPESDYAVWNPATSYTVGTRVIRAETHRIYENILAGVNATLPELDPTRWLDIGPTNRWAMFDSVVGTKTTGASPLVVVIRPGQIDSVAFQELSAESIRVVLKDSVGGTTVFDQFIDLEFSQITDFYEWFFTPYEARTDAVLANIPPYPGGELTVTITGSGTVSCGLMVIGNSYELGDTQYGAQLGILNFSVKSTDTFGNTTITPRGYARRMDVKLWQPAALLNRTYRLLSSLKDTPCVWIATETAGYEVMTVYGFYRDFTIDISYFDTNICNLQIEGLI